MTEPPVPRAGQVSLAGLKPGAAAVELLFGLQQRTRQGVKTYCAILRAAANDARTQQVPSLAELDILAVRGQGYASVVHTLITHARRGVSDPGTEIAKDIWDMTLFGHRGNLSFTAITQPWLRETAKIWALADLPAAAQRRGHTGHHPSSMAFLLGSLRQRADHGEDPAALDARTWSFSSTASATFMPPARSASSPGCWAAASCGKLLTSARAGQARPGPAARPPGSATSSPSTPATCPMNLSTANPAGTCRRRSCSRSAASSAPSPHRHIRTAIEILIYTYAAPTMFELPLDCLASDPGGAAVLVYDNHKAHRLGAAAHQLSHS